MSYLKLSNLWSGNHSVPAELIERIPNLLVFEINSELETFFEETCNMARGEYDIDLLLAEALLYISDRNYLEPGLEALHAQLLDCHSQERGFSPHDGPVLAEASVKLARSMSQKFDHLGAYLPDGTLPFQFKNFTDIYSYTPTPVLERCLEFIS
jgi:hypothetical protein